MKRFLLALGWLLVVPAIAAERAAMQIRTSAIANLYYQMDCLTGARSCSSAAYENLWQEQGWLNEQTNEALGEFAKIQARYQTDVWLTDRSSQPPEPLGPPVPDLGPNPNDYFSLAQRLRVAAYGSDSVAELRDRLQLVMTLADADALAALVGRFEQRFMLWWEQQAATELARMATELRVVLDRDVNSFLSAAASFYGIDDPDFTQKLALHLMYRPGGSGPTRGQQLQNLSVVEVLHGERAEQRMGVVVHELAHYLFSAAPQRWHRQRLEGALQARSPQASVALGLMDEALASAVGNGALELKLRGPEEFADYRAADLSYYNDPQIDRAAKLVTDQTIAYLERGQAMDGPFVKAYYSDVLNELNAQFNTLEQRLAVTSVVVGDDALNEYFGQLRQRINTRSVWTHMAEDSIGQTVLARHAYLNGVVLARPGQLNSILADLGEGPTSVSEGQVCTLARAGGGLLYVAELSALPKVDAMVKQMRRAESCPGP